MRDGTLNILLFILTLVSTTVAGAVLAGINPLETPLKTHYGCMFSLPLMAILVFHECGHYIAARRHGVAVTPPFFIPAPPPFIIGTFGAFIKIKSPLPDRNALIDIGAAGPIAGMVVAVPVLVVGLVLSEAKELGQLQGISLGTSLLFEFLTKAIHGSIPEGYDIVLHPVAFAGWIGMLVTALNLLPVGQLDGGHVAYALFGDRYTGVSRIFPLLLIPMGMLWMGWLLWALLLILLGTGHPPPMDVETELTPGRKMVGYVCIFLFIICFTPVPASF